MGGASGGLSLRFDGAGGVRGANVRGVRADGAGVARGEAGGVKADAAGSLWAGGFDAAGSLWAGWLGAVANKTPPTLQKQTGSGSLHQIMPQRGSQGVNKALQGVGITV